MTCLNRLLIGIVPTACLMLYAGMAMAKPSSINVAYFLEWPTANLIARMDNTYDKELGVKVNWRAFGNGNEMTQAMASGDVQVAFSQGAVPFVVAVSNGLPLRAVGIAAVYAKADNCVVRKGTGITKDNAKKLEDQKVATPIGNVTQYGLLRMLDHLGVDANKVDMVQMNGADASIALARGDVAMACAFGGPLLRMEQYGSVLMTAKEREAIGLQVFDVVSVTEDFAKENPDLVEKFMEVTSKANKEYAADPKKYQPVIADASGMDLAAAKQMLGMFTFPAAAEQASDKWLGGNTVAKYMKQVADFLVQQGQMDKALDDYSNTIEPTFVEQAAGDKTQ